MDLHFSPNSQFSDLKGQEIWNSATFEDIFTVSCEDFKCDVAVIDLGDEEDNPLIDRKVMECLDIV